MSAQLKVSLHHVATWSHSSIHHSLLPPLLREARSPAQSPQRGGWKRRRTTVSAPVEDQVGPWLSLMFHCVNSFQLLIYVLTLSERASLKVLFVLLWCIHRALWKRCTYEIIDRAKLRWSHATSHNPSILLAASWLYYFGEDGARAFSREARTSDDWPLFEPEGDLTGCGPPDTHNTHSALRWYQRKNLMDDPEHIILRPDLNLNGSSRQ